jgi:hypothetical protein
MIYGYPEAYLGVMFVLSVDMCDWFSGRLSVCLSVFMLVGLLVLWFSFVRLPVWSLGCLSVCFGIPVIG